MKDNAKQLLTNILKIKPTPATEQEVRNNIILLGDLIVRTEQIIEYLSKKEGE